MGPKTENEQSLLDPGTRTLENNQTKALPQSGRPYPYKHLQLNQNQLYHPHSTLHKILHHANILANFESQNETSGNANRHSLKYSEIWSSIANSCQLLLKPKNPQFLPLTLPI